MKKALATITAPPNDSTIPMKSWSLNFSFKTIQAMQALVMRTVVPRGAITEAGAKAYPRKLPISPLEKRKKKSKISQENKKEMLKGSCQSEKGKKRCFVGLFLFGFGGLIFPFF